jgi:hypothetical protein
MSGRFVFASDAAVLSSVVVKRPVSLQLREAVLRILGILAEMLGN